MDPLVIEHGPEYEGGVRFHAVSLILLFHAIVVGFIFAAKVYIRYTGIWENLNVYWMYRKEREEHFCIYSPVVFPYVFE